MRKKNPHEFTSETGRAATKGRKPGSKNKLTRESWTLIDQLFADYRKYGKETLRVLRAENPVGYARLVYDLAGKLALDDPGQPEVPKILVIRWLDDSDEAPPVPMVKGDDNVVKMIDLKPIPTSSDPAA
jgi:hypothetical protein